ncbi:DotU/TssL family secretion system protein [Enterobacter hormaechei]|uniref:DotU/TssL family secretion system protein n=1 Tax=Enterobacter hormaechei TaxID=158836 RepID=UPI001868707A|nr:DotU/TssL family secretion system protein [Enterobacter hormaechei]
MNDADIDLINKTFYPGWLMVSQLRSGQEVKDGEALYRRACRWVNAARESLNEAGFSTTSCDHMLYAYCALMDESVLNRDKQDDGYRQWRKDPLQARFFRTLNAGEELWERIRTALREPAPDVVRALSERVPPFALTQETPVVVRASRLRSGRRMYWLGWVAGVVVLAALWFTFSSVLSQMVAQIAGQG